MHDCCFSQDGMWFRYRAAAIIVEDGCVLFVGNANENYYYSVGGGVQHGETAQAAVVREVFEETGVEYEVDRLAVIHENFFDQNQGTLKGLCCHEIAFYFLMKPRGSQQLHSHSFTHGAKEEMYWLPIDQLDRYPVFPQWMQSYLQAPSPEVQHIITDDRKR